MLYATLSNLLHLSCSFNKVPIADWRLHQNPVLAHNLTTSFILRCQMLPCSLWMVDQGRTAPSCSSHNKSQCQVKKCIKLVCILALVSDSILFNQCSGVRNLELFLISVFCYGLQSIIHHLLKGLRRNCKGEFSKHVAKDTLHVAASDWYSSTLCLHTSAGFFFLPQVWLLPSCLKSSSSVKQN